MATEIELKFRIPAPRLAALQRAVATASAERQPLAAAYFDTPGQHLARARMALRLRREGDAWVQTLKAEGSGPLQRLEDNAPVPGGDRPALDIARHDGSAAGAALRRLLADAGQPPLQERYATRVQRTRRVLRSGGAVVELALDLGEVRAGDRSVPLCEIEFELLSGPPQALLALVGRWVARHGLRLDMRSKSELGHTLAAGLAGSPPTPARPLRLDRHADLAHARSAMLSNTLGQVLANASQMAAGPAEPAHLHQLRVGLRRLRSVLGACWPADADCPPGDPVPALRSALAALGRPLGAARDADALGAGLWPALQAAGAPPLPPAPVPLSPVPDPAALLQAPATQHLWLALIALGLPADGARPPDAGLDASQPAAGALAAPLQRLWRQVRRDARRIDGLDDAACHRLRRRIKRLRYLTELGAGLWPDKPAARLLRRLKAAQQALGERNDTAVALDHFRRLVAQDPQAWFAVGWLSARQAALRPASAAVLQRLARATPPWQRR